MILGLGCDIVKVSRFDRGYKFLTHFVKKYLTLKEINELHHKITASKESELVLALATRFAAKEAVSKALGSGFRNGITLQNIEITHNQLGKPEVTLYQNALARAYLVANNTAFKIHLTISNEHEYVNAVAVLETI